MTRWERQVAEGPVQGALDNVLELMEDESFASLEGSDLEEFQRLKKCLHFVFEILKGTEPEFVPQSSLDSFNNTLSPLSAQVQAFTTNQQITHLQQANTHADALLHHAGIIAGLSPNFSTVSESLTAALEKRVELAERRKTELAAQVSGLKTQVSNAENKLQALDERTGAKLAELDRIALDAGEKFNANQSHRQESFQSKMEDFSKTASTTIDDVKDKISEKASEHYTSFEEELEAHRVSAEEMHSKIRKLHGLVANDSVSGPEESRAFWERISANVFRGLSFLLLLGTAWIMYDTLPQASQATDPSFFIWRITISLILLGAAGYAAQQSAMHRQQAQQLHRFVFETSALRPYLQDLPEEDRHDVRRKLTEKYFGHVYEEGAGDRKGAWVPNSIPEWVIGLIKNNKG